MSRYAKRRGGAVEVRIPDEVRQLLTLVLRRLDELLDTTSEAADHGDDVDPLAALTGMHDTDRDRPDDPALLRLRPDAYAPEVEDGQAATDFRRFTEADLEALQRSRVALVLEQLAEGDPVRLTDDEAEAWLGALNDARLAMAARLGIDHDEWEPGPDTPPDLWLLYHLVSDVFHDVLTALT